MTIDKILNKFYRENITNFDNIEEMPQCYFK